MHNNGRNDKKSFFFSISLTAGENKIIKKIAKHVKKYVNVYRISLLIHVK